jgi:hypothetical protein
MFSVDNKVTMSDERVLDLVPPECEQLPSKTLSITNKQEMVTDSGLKNKSADHLSNSDVRKTQPEGAMVDDKEDVLVTLPYSDMRPRPR